MGGNRIPGPLGLHDEDELLCRPRGPDEYVCGGRPQGPLDSAEAIAYPECNTAGPLGFNDYAGELADYGYYRPTQGNDGTPDHELLVVEVDPRDKSVPDNTFLETTAENLVRFGYQERTNWPGAVQDLKSVVNSLKEFGATRFYVMPGKGPGKAGKKYLVFKGNPRNPGRHLGLRQMIRGNGPYSFKNPQIVRMGFGWDNALRSGAKATCLSFILVAGIDVFKELMQDEFSLVSLGINLTVDTVKLVLSLLGGAAGGAAAIALTNAAALGALPVLVVALAVFLAGVGAGLALDWVDEELGITQALQRRAQELQQRAEWGLLELLGQLDACIRNGCFMYR